MSFGLWGCGLLSPAPAEAPPAPAAPSASAAEPAELQEPSIAIHPSLPVIVQARLRYAANGVAQDSWIDFEVSGPAQHAFAACKALVHREMNQKLPPELRLEVARPCSHEAIAEPPANGKYALVTVQRYEPVELTILLGPDAMTSEALTQVRVRRRDLSGYEDEAACKAMRDRLEEARVRAEKDAQSQAVQWLDSTLGRTRTEADAACKKNPESAECRNTKSLIPLLEKRKAQESEGSRSSLPSAICRQR